MGSGKSKVNVQRIVVRKLDHANVHKPPKPDESDSDSDGERESSAPVLTQFDSSTLRRPSSKKLMFRLNKSDTWLGGDGEDPGSPNDPVTTQNEGRVTIPYLQLGLEDEGTDGVNSATSVADIVGLEDLRPVVDGKTNSSIGPSTPTKEVGAVNTEKDDYYTKEELDELRPRTAPKLLADHYAAGVVINYQKGELIGTGAFGRVHMAMNQDTGELMAVKEVQIAGLSTGRVRENVEALEREIELLRRLRHENIVTYHGTQRGENCLNILLEYVPGGSLASLISNFGSFSEQLTRTYARQILLGLEYLHANNIMHRDIKGGNILADNTGCIKLADFGASRRIEDLVNQSHGFQSFRGSSYWMAPEVIKQTGYGRQADIWSVGCTIIEMGTGRPPWSQYSQVAALFQIASEESMPEYPENWSLVGKEFLNLCFQRNPKSRPNATKLLKHPWLSPGMPVGGQPVPRKIMPQGRETMYMASPDPGKDNAGTNKHVPAPITSFRQPPPLKPLSGAGVRSGHESNSSLVSTGSNDGPSDGGKNRLRMPMKPSAMMKGRSGSASNLLSGDSDGAKDGPATAGDILVGSTISNHRTSSLPVDSPTPTVDEELVLSSPVHETAPVMGTEGPGRGSDPGLDRKAWRGSVGSTAETASAATTPGNEITPSMIAADGPSGGDILLSGSDCDSPASVGALLTTPRYPEEPGLRRKLQEKSIETDVSVEDGSSKSATKEEGGTSIGITSAPKPVGFQVSAPGAVEGAEVGFKLPVVTQENHSSSVEKSSADRKLFKLFGGMSKGMQVLGDSDGPVRAANAIQSTPCSRFDRTGSNVGRSQSNTSTSQSTHASAETRPYIPSPSLSRSVSHDTLDEKENISSADVPTVDRAEQRLSDDMTSGGDELQADDENAKGKNKKSNKVKFKKPRDTKKSRSKSSAKAGDDPAVTIVVAPVSNTVTSPAVDVMSVNDIAEPEEEWLWDPDHEAIRATITPPTHLMKNGKKGKLPALRGPRRGVSSSAWKPERKKSTLSGFFKDMFGPSEKKPIEERVQPFDAGGGTGEACNDSRIESAV